MPIERLPQNTIQTVASSQALTDSRSVIKELVDNSLDAQASAIFIEISANVVDIIQVRDNGHGIFPGDRSLVGKRYYTSKIRNLNDLETIGGMSLGFRGEALASAAELSGSMMVSTRIEGEATAVSLTIGQDGKIEKEERTSQAVGTTVRIIDFLKPIPVRRQTAIKASLKHLAAIKTLLQAYALARLTVRFGLKVLKAKNHKSDWTYAPMKGDTTADAVVKIMGNKIAEQCQWKTWSTSLPESPESRGSNEKNDMNVEKCYIVEAFLPAPTCDLKHVNSVGQFISVDSRPVSCSRGTFKQIVSLYKSYLAFGDCTKHSDTHRDPFLCMNIKCPPGSYDVNIEPAKDDILFTDARFVIDSVEALFKSVYGELRTREAEIPRSKKTNLNSRGFDIFLAKKPVLLRGSVPKLDDLQLNKSLSNGSPASSFGLVRDIVDPSLRAAFSETHQEVEPECSGGCDLALRSTASTPPPKDSRDKITIEQPPDKPRCSWRSNMWDSESSDDLATPSNQTGKSLSGGSPMSEGDEVLYKAEGSNPWILAKINAPLHLHAIREPIANPNSNHQLSAKKTGKTEGISSKSGNSFPYLPTPQRSEMWHSSPTFRSSPIIPQRVWQRKDHKEVSKQRGTPEQFSKGSWNLDSWLNAAPKGRSVAPCSGSLTDGDIQLPRVLSHANDPSFTSTRNLAAGPPPSPIPHTAIESLLKPLEGEQQMENQSGPPIFPVSNLANVGDYKSISKSERSTPIRSIHPDLADTMDYELRKQEAIQNWKANKRRNEAIDKKCATSFEDTALHENPSPYQNRYKKAIAALHPIEIGEKIAPQTSLDPSDPRAYLIRVQQCESTAAPGDSSPHLRKRRKTSRLPLESLQEDSIVRDLTLCINSESLDLETQITGLVVNGTCIDQYIKAGTIQASFSPPMPTVERVRLWKTALQELVQKLYSEHDVGKCGSEDEDTMHLDLDLDLDLWPVLQSHLAAAYP